MDARRRTHAPDSTVGKRLPAQRIAEPADALLKQAAPADLQRLVPLFPAALRPSDILSMQRSVGNQTVLRFLEPGLLRQTARPTGSASLAKSAVREEEELAKPAKRDEEELAKAAPVSRSTDGVAVSVQQTAPLHHAASVADDGLLAKVGTSVKPGAAPTQALGGDYGITYPEIVDAKIGAKLDKAAGTWSPKVKSLTGHYSMQTTLLGGQSEITGPGGNTSKTNFCDQATALEKLGYDAKQTWYMIKAVKVHEGVHASRFGPALKNAVAAITAKLEAVTVPHTAGMKESKAIKDIQADPTYATEIGGAQGLWLAEIYKLVAKDHDPGGPTDKAEQTVTEPMRKKICSHAKKKKWPACAACP